MQPGAPLIDFGWLGDHVGALWTATIQHVELTVLPVVIGFVISLFLSVWAARRPSVYGPLITLAGILYTIPSLALFAVLIPITGLTLITVLIPMVSYTILIYVRSIVAGIRGVPAEVLESADGMGYTSRQRLIRVELPLAVPMMITGMRLATVTTIGLVTVASIIGGSEFGGYGQLTTDGRRTLFPPP